MKIALFAFNGDPMCFVHVLLNAFDLRERGHETTIVLEGTATKLARSLEEDPEAPFAPMYKKAREAGLIGCVCKACANKTGALASVEAQGLKTCAEMTGHPSIGRYMDEGWQVLTI